MAARPRDSSASISIVKKKKNNFCFVVWPHRKNLQFTNTKATTKFELKDLFTNIVSLQIVLIVLFIQ